MKYLVLRAVGQHNKLYVVYLLTVAEAGFNSRSLGMQIQKKLFGKLATKGIVKALIDDDTGVLLDMLHKLAAKEMDQKRAQKLVKDLIKVVIKVGLLYRNHQFSDAELALGLKFKMKLRNLALTVISFHEVAFSYDKGFLVSSINDAAKLLHDLVERHLTVKSHGRINNVIGFFTTGDLLDKVFSSDGAYHDMLPTISEVFSRVVDQEWTV